MPFLLITLLGLTACQPHTLSTWYYNQASEINYTGIRTEDRKNKSTVRSELDK